MLMDVCKAFDSVEHRCIIELLDDHIQKDGTRFRRLLEQLILAPISDPCSSTTWVPTVGVAQGGPLSALMLNLLLDTVDRAVLETPQAQSGRLCYARYSDNLALLVQCQGSRV